MQNSLSKNILKITCGNSEATFMKAKLIKLILKGITIIDQNDNHDNQEKEFLSSGSYLMYPWVGRIKHDEKIVDLIKTENSHLQTKQISVNFPFKDSSKNNFPLHGFFANSDREILKHERDIVIFSSVVSENNIIKNCFPDFVETFKILEDRLEVYSTFKNSSNNNCPQYFAYGYHPYISFPGKQINNLVISSNINRKIKLGGNLMPEVSGSESLILTDCNLSGKLNEIFYDDLFYKEEDSIAQINPFISLYDEESKIKVTIENINLNTGSKFSDNENFPSRVNLNYFQIYTPSNRDKIAIEPMSSISNAFNVDFPNHLVKLNPNEEKRGEFHIKLELEV
jgi:galactose mutarotase-like enzyme